MTRVVTVPASSTGESQSDTISESLSLAQICTLNELIFFFTVHAQYLHREATKALIQRFAY